MQCKDLKLDGEFNFKTLASQTPGFVGADLSALVREAAMCAVTRYESHFHVEYVEYRHVCQWNGTWLVTV